MKKNTTLKSGRGVIQSSLTRLKEVDMAGWALQDAKGRFSELVECAKDKGPQLVTRRGKAAVMVVAVEQFRQLVRMRDKDGLVDFFHNSPLAELDSTLFDRDRDVGRTVV